MLLCISLSLSFLLPSLPLLPHPRNKTNLKISGLIGLIIFSRARGIIRGKLKEHNKWESTPRNLDYRNTYYFALSTRSLRAARFYCVRVNLTLEKKKKKKKREKRETEKLREISRDEYPMWICRYTVWLLFLIRIFCSSCNNEWRKKKVI